MGDQFPPTTRGASGQDDIAQRINEIANAINSAGSGGQFRPSGLSQQEQQVLGQFGISALPLGLSLPTIKDEEELRATSQVGGPFALPELRAGRSVGLTDEAAASALRISSELDRIQKAVFFDGDQRRPSSWDSIRVASLQEDLQAMGILSAPYPKGVWDQQSEQAFEFLLSWANQQGISTVDEAKQKFLAIHETLGVAKPEPPPLEVNLSNPDELKRAFRPAIINALGKGWSEDKLDRMVAAYHEAERSHQRKVWEERAGAEPGEEFEIIQPPSAETFAQSEAERADPSAAATNRGLEFIQLLEGSL